MSVSLDVTTSHVGDTDVVSPAGEIDIATAPAVRAAMAATVGPRRLVLDLRQVEFMDTSGLALLVDEDRRARSRGGEFAVVAATASVQRLLDIAGLTPRLRLAATPEEAAALGAHEAA